MRIVFTLLLIIAALAVAAHSVRARDRAASNALLAFAGVFFVMLVAAFFGVL